MTGQRRLSIPDIERTDRPDGSIILRNRTALPEPLPDVLTRFDYWVERDGEAPFIGEEDAGDSKVVSYGEIDRISDGAAHLLRSRGVVGGQPVAVLGGAGTAHAALKLACLKIGGAYTLFARAHRLGFWP